MEQPKIPTLKDSQKPQVKIKGLAAGMSLFDRLKTFKKKDLAFILAGLGTLFMAPLAEHFMMAPESGDGTMQQGWGGKGGSNLFGSGSSPYESGITGLAPGGAIGGGGDVITPLNVRDPSALVMGPGMTQQPPAGSLAPQTPPPAAAKEPDLKDALANAAARAAGAATRRAPVPVPKPAMTGSGLRGLGVASGGSSAGAGLAPINSAGLSTNKAAGSSSLSDVRPATGFRGVATRGPGKGGGGSEALKAAAGGAGDLFNRGGSAAGNAEQAAQVAMPGGNAFGGGNGGAGGADKGPGGNNSNGSKSVGESLEFLRQKQEMEKALDLKWKMKEKRAMFPLELQQEAAKTIVMDGVVKPLAGMFGDLMKSSFGPNSQQVFRCTEGPVPASEVSMNGDRGCSGKRYYQTPGTRGIDLVRCGNDKGAGGGPPAYTGCILTTSPASSDSSGEAAERGRGPDPYSPAGQGPAGYQGMNITTICQKLRGTDAGFRPGAETEHLQTQAARLASAIDAMNAGAVTSGSGSLSGACEVTRRGSPGNILSAADKKIEWAGTETDTLNIRARQEFIKNNMLNGPNGVITIMANAAEAWRAANAAAKNGVAAQADAAKTGAPNFEAPDQQISANMNNALTGNNEGSGRGGFQSLNEASFQAINRAITRTGELLDKVEVPTEADITQLNGAPMNLPGRSEAQAIVTDLKLIAQQQTTVRDALRREQALFPDRHARANQAYQGGRTLSTNVTNILTPDRAAAPTAGPVGDPPTPIPNPVSYNQTKTRLTEEARKTDPAPASNPALGRDGTLARAFNTTSDALGNQIGTGAAQNNGSATAATGWTLKVSQIMGEAAPAQPATVPPAR